MTNIERGYVRGHERATGITDLRELGRRIQQLRSARGMSQADLAGPYSRAYVSLLEAGGIAPSRRALRTLADRLGVSPAALEAKSTQPFTRGTLQR